MKYLSTALLSAVAASYAFAAPAPLGEVGFEGCTPGYWKNHPERWDGTGGDDFTITVQHQAEFNMFFGVTKEQSGLPYGTTLLEAADTGGGGLAALARHAAAAAASSDATINYLYTLAEVIAIYRDGVGADPGTLDVEEAKNALEAANQAGCPLGNDDPDITPYCFGDEGNCPCGDFLGGGGCLHSGGQGALLSAIGSTSVAADDLVLTTTQLPPNTYSMTFMGLQGGNTPFGNGRLCVSSPGSKLFRYKPAQNSTPTGTIQLGPGIAALSLDFQQWGGNITPGSTWYFQTYFRDINPNCNANFNLSNAVRIDFVP
ncbi:MAG: hypothetical protein H6831_00195 [Planctomycetes bacterium]|nr:hypothetical protein [Planctomycetota bacterium]MCB9902805.1 hypothetical protein [Planctomycetota bacterium]